MCGAGGLGRVVVGLIVVVNGCYLVVVGDVGSIGDCVTSDDARSGG